MSNVCILLSPWLLLIRICATLGHESYFWPDGASLPTQVSNLLPSLGWMLHAQKCSMYSTQTKVSAILIQLHLLFLFNQPPLLVINTCQFLESVNYSKKRLIITLDSGGFSRIQDSSFHSSTMTLLLQNWVSMLVLSIIFHNFWMARYHCHFHFCQNLSQM